MEKAKDHSTVTVDLTADDGTASKLARAAPSIISSFSLSSPSSSTPSTPSLGFTAAARQWLLSSMFIRVPLHYLKRKGVGMVLLGMILFAYLHGLLLPHDADAHVSTSPYASSSSTATSNKPSSLSLLSLDSDADETSTQNSRGGWLQDLFDFISSSSGGGGAKGDPGLAHILHRPEQGVAPLRGVDEEGLEIVDDAYLAIGEQHMSVPPPATGLQEKGGQDTVHSADQAQHQQPITPFIDGHGSSAISIQFPFEHQRPMSAERERILAERRQFVTNMIRHAWAGYAERAAPADELRPVSGSPHPDSAYNGWAATAVDSLDTLLLAGLDQEYQEARQIVFDAARKHQWRAAMQPMPLEAGKDTDAESSQNNIDTETGKDSGIVVSDTINLYLGGLLSAAVLKEDPELLDAANRVAQSLLPAFKETKGALPSSILFKK
ncbi:hypothetical protein BGW42_002164 [Actinomortierella wolfii]|nr:hypothetical protein BGW42_002164 [Actinomortierella wolfii]